MEEYKVLAMNFGSTSTKVAVYEGDTQLLVNVFHHSPKELEGVSSMEENAALRKPLILAYLKDNNVDLRDFDAIVGRGGLVHPLEGGTYAVNDKMLEDLRNCTYGTHVCNLGGILAAEIGAEIGKPAYVVDPPVIDELSELARLSGCPDFPRRPLFHALNQKAIAKRYAAEYGLPYDSLRLIVAHMGGGVTVGAHLYGKIVDVNNGLEGEGAYTAERPGTLAVLDVLRAAFSGKYGSTFQELREFFTFHCGLAAYVGTNDGREVTRRIRAGDRQAELAYQGMAYQIAKEIGAAGAVLQGEVDAILLTGGFANDPMLMGWIEESVRYLAPVHVYPGEDEMLALAQGAIRVLKGQEEVQVY
ncbi:MAG TPA: butyrate kinase [Candidatus Faecousia faecigallinarum]|nr:butyrate kinase [Candidatus Faecousia faecigallinarum]